MPPRETRVLVVRTSRFVHTALTRARREWPGADVRVLHQTGCEPEIEAAGVPPPARYALPAGTRVTPLSLLAHPSGRQAIAWQPDHVVIQWWNPQGRGHERVDWAAMLVGRGGFHVVFEDACLIRVRAVRRMLRPVRPAWRVARGVLLIVAVATATILVWPATLWHDWRSGASAS